MRWVNEDAGLQTLREWGGNGAVDGKGKAGRGRMVVRLRPAGCYEIRLEI